MNTLSHHRNLLPTRRGASAAKVILIIVVILVVLAAACGGGCFFLFQKGMSEAGKQAIPSMQANAVITEKVGTITSAKLQVMKTAELAQQNGGGTPNLMAISIEGDKGSAVVNGIFTPGQANGAMTMGPAVIIMNDVATDVATGEVATIMPWNTPPALPDPADIPVEVPGDGGEPAPAGG
ncbi:MAG: hypothetical protein AB8G96_01160 [Phycisphaerales bacterium]